VSIRPRSSQPAPRHAHTIEDDLRQRLAAIRCPVHGDLAAAELSVEDDGAVSIVPFGCCAELERIVLAALRESVTLVPPAPDCDEP
jgi:hypothetical protein